MPSVFPTYLKPISSAYLEEGIEGTHRTPFEDGFVAQKPFQSRQRVTKTLTCLLESKQRRKDFKAWHASLILGSDWFTYFDPDDEKDVNARIISGKYQIQSVRANKYRVSFLIEMFEPVFETESIPQEVALTGPDGSVMTGPDGEILTGPDS